MLASRRRNTPKTNMEILWVLYYVPDKWSFSKLEEFRLRQGAYSLLAPADVPFWWRYDGVLPVLASFIVPSSPVVDERQISLCL